MASDITSSASFTESNMKPANSEVIPAVWGQNIADNTGFLYHDERFVGNCGGGKEGQDGTIGSYSYGLTTVYNGTFHTGIGFQKKSRFDAITGTLLWNYTTDDADITGTVWIRLRDEDNVEYGTIARYGTKHSSDDSTYNHIQSFDFDSSALATGEQYYVDLYGWFDLVGGATGNDSAEIKLLSLQCYVST